MSKYQIQEKIQHMCSALSNPNTNATPTTSYENSKYFPGTFARAYLLSFCRCDSVKIVTATQLIKSYRPILEAQVQSFHTRPRNLSRNLANLFSIECRSRHIVFVFIFSQRLSEREMKHDRKDLGDSTKWGFLKSQPGWGAKEKGLAAWTVKLVMHSCKLHITSQYTYTSM